MIRFLQNKEEYKNIRNALKESLKVDGYVGECGVCYGGFVLFACSVYKEMGITKQIYLFDTFEGMPHVEKQFEKEAWKRARKGFVLFERELPTIDKIIDSYKLEKIDLSLVSFYKGLFSNTLPNIQEKFCFIHGDGDFYESTCDIIKFANRCLNVGGFLVLHDYGSIRHPGVKRAVDELINPKKYKIISSIRKQIVLKRIKD